MDPLRVAIFIIFFGLFLLVVKKLFNSEIPNPAHVPPTPYPEPPESSDEESGQTGLTGSEIPFPISVPQRVQREDGTWNRPEVRNYFFAKTDLLRGPEDRQTFCDELTIQFEIPEDHQRWFEQYTVATPAGLDRFLTTQKSGAVMMEHKVILVPRWDLGAILQAIMDDTIEIWSLPDAADGMVIDSPPDIPGHTS